MKDSYNNYVNKLSGEYKSVFSDIETFGWTVDIDSILFEEKMSELLDVFISAQEENREVGSIIGDDVNTFCRNFFDEIPKISRVREFFDSIKRVAWCILVFDIIDILVCMGSEEESVSDISSLLFLFFGAYVLSRLLEMGVRKSIYKKDKMNYKKRRTIVVGVDIVLMVLLLFIASKFMEGLLNISSIVEVSVLAVYLIIYYLVNHKRLKADKKVRPEVSFSDRIANELAPAMQKKFDKKNAKLMKKGKTPYTWQEFVENENRETNKLPKVAKFYLVLPIIIILIMLVIMISTGCFESTIDIFTFVGIVLIVEYLIMFFFYKVEMNSYKARVKWGEEQLKIYNESMN